MQNRNVRMSVNFLASDARELLRSLPDGEGLDSLEIVDGYEEEIVEYIERLEAENAALKAKAA